jgi:hypothetical protein
MFVDISLGSCNSPGSHHIEYPGFLLGIMGIKEQKVKGMKLYLRIYLQLGRWQA